MSLTLFTKPLHELGTVTAPSAAAFPKERLYDRDRGLQWQADAIAQKDIDVDLGSSMLASAWALVNHNLTVTVEIRTGSDGITFATLQDSALVTGVDPFYRTFAQASSRYWRVRLPAGAVEAKIGELLLGVPVTLPNPHLAPGRIETTVGNVRRDRSPGGYSWNLKRGPALRRSRWAWAAMFDAELTSLRQAFTESGEGAKKFLAQDETGTWRWTEFLSDIVEARRDDGLWNVSVDVQESL